MVILLIPIIFIIILKLYYLIIPKEEVGIKGDWIIFSGGYIGSITALWGIWWQVDNEKKEEKKKMNIEILKNMLKEL